MFGKVIERSFDQRFGVRTRNEHAWRNTQSKRPKISVAQEIGDRTPLATLTNYLSIVRSFWFCQGPIGL
jgi:hypothetical protein